MTFKTTRLQLFLSSFLFLISFQISVAQYDDLLQNKEIIWLAEFTVDFQFSTEVDFQEEQVQLLKFQNNTSSFKHSNRNDWIKLWIFNQAMQDASNCYLDPNFTQKLNIDDLSDITESIDTVITFNTETYEERISIISNKSSSRNIKGLRTNQVIYFNQKTNNFETRLIAVAPLFRKNSKTPKPLFWIKMNAVLPDNFNINQSNINWATLICPIKHPLEANFMEVIKSPKDFNFKDKLYDQAFNLEKPTQKFYGRYDPMTKSDLKKAYNSIDTITTFDPTTFEEEIKIVKSEFSPASISQYRLVQEWYYDREKNSLTNRLKAICPLASSKNNEGKELYSSPLYYIRYDTAAQ